MACALTQGYTFIGCKDQVAGIDEVLICEYGNVNVSSIALTANVVTTLTCATGKQFRQYILDKEKGEFSCDLTGNKENSVNTYLHKVMFTTNKISTSMIEEMDLIAKNYCVIIVKDNNGTYWLMGRVKGMELITGGINSEKAVGGFIGQVWTFESVQPAPMKAVNSSLISVLLSPAV